MARSLAVERVAERIKECVFENRVTLIIGKTGCGKSSRVPQLLQSELGGPIVCTQPRRLAVVAIARHVAELTGSQLGREVGFRIGQKSAASSQTKILFTTAGLLLEELRANGPAALKKYSCLIVDELHERSVESDLLLACIHAMMVPGALAGSAAAAAAAATTAASSSAAVFAGPAELPSLKLVLMSATANVERCKQYFKLPGEHVSLIQCDVAERMSSAIGTWLETVKVVYLEQVVSKLLANHPNAAQHISVLQQHKDGAITPQRQVDLPMQQLIRDLILQLQLDEEDPQAVFLVFLPTYRALELQHRLLLEARGRGGEYGEAASKLELFPLHSSVDIDEAMRSMQEGVGSGHRKVILATNVAESSVTIPHVKHVIDACTTNQVYWDAAACRERAKVVWASQSAAEQRSGRTGRTCSGTAYRLLPRAAFLKLDRFEASALTLRSLRREVLCLLSAGSRSMSDPALLLGQALDAPEPEVVKDALDYLQQVGAASINAKGRMEPTQTGAFIAALPIALDSSLLLMKGGLMGQLWESAVLAALMNATPYPIRQPFGSEAMVFVKLYYYGPDSQAGVGTALDQAGLAAAGAAAAAAQPAAAAPWADMMDDSTDNEEIDGLPSAAAVAAAAGLIPSYGLMANGYSSSAAVSNGQMRTDRIVQLLANLAAFEAWQQQWCDVQRLKQLLAVGSLSQQSSSGTAAAAAKSGTSNDGVRIAAAAAAGIDADVVGDFPPALDDDFALAAPAGAAAVSADEAAWCQQHHVLPSSLRHVNDTLNIIISAIHKYRPSFMHRASGPPEYYKRQVSHRCEALCPAARLVEGGCSCQDIHLSCTNSPQQRRQLMQLLTQVFGAGTAAADAQLLQVTPESYLGSSSSSMQGSRSRAAAAGLIESDEVYGLVDPDAHVNIDDYYDSYNSYSDAYDGYDGYDNYDSFSNDTEAPVCKFFLSDTGCRKGARCTFRHVRPACKFFLTRGGCMYGSDCRFLHHVPSSSGSSGSRGGGSSGSSSFASAGVTTVLEQQQQQQLGLTFDWSSNKAATAAAGSCSDPYDDIINNLVQDGSSKSSISDNSMDIDSSSSSKSLILLLGEGDFSFTAALLRRRVAAAAAAGAAAGADIVATSYEQQEQLKSIYPGRALTERLELLKAAGVDVRFGVDATRLYEGLSQLHVSRVQHIVWNFPLAVSAEAQQAAANGRSSSSSSVKLLGDDDEANRHLMGRFMAAAARQMASWNLGMKLHIALCLDQYSRWGMDSIARSNFLFLQRSQQLQLTQWPGYTPRRGLMDGSFPTDRAVVYTFGLQLPTGHIASVKKLQMQLRVLECKMLLAAAKQKEEAAAAAAAAGGADGTAAAGIFVFGFGGGGSSKHNAAGGVLGAANTNSTDTGGSSSGKGSARGLAAGLAVAGASKTTGPRRSARLAKRHGASSPDLGGKQPLWRV